MLAPLTAGGWHPRKPGALHQQAFACTADPSPKPLSQLGSTSAQTARHGSSNQCRALPSQQRSSHPPPLNVTDFVGRPQHAYIAYIAYGRASVFYQGSPAHRPDGGHLFRLDALEGFFNYTSPVLLNDDNSSNYCHSLDDPIYEEEDGRWARSSIPTLVSDDCDDMRSKRSSGGPLSPHSVSGSTTSRTGDRGLYGSAPGSLGFVASSVDELDEDDDDFSEGDGADEYHRFTTNLAKVDKQRGREIVSSTPIMRSKSLTSRLSVSARSLFSRRRDSHRSPWSRSSLDTPRSHLETDLHHAQTMHLLHSDKSSINSPALSGPPDDDSTGPRSIFEYSEDEESDDEERHMREALRDFFAPARRSGSDEDKKKKKKKDEARTLNRKGRKQNLRAQIQAIPE